MNALSSEIVVDDDPGIRELLMSLLMDSGHLLDAVMNRTAKANLPPRPTADILLIDITPAREGDAGRFRVMRPRPELSALILSAVGADDDRKRKSDLEADDWGAERLSTQDLFARILELGHSFGSLVAPNDEPSGRSARFAGWKLDLARHELSSAGSVRAHLPETEFALLMAFLDHPRQMLTREQLVGYTRGNKRHVSVRTLDVYVSRLRRSLRADPDSADTIARRRKQGYVFNADVVFE